MNFMRKDFILLGCLVLGFAIFSKVAKKDNAINAGPSTIKEQKPDHDVNSVSNTAVVVVKPSQIETLPSPSPEPTIQAPAVAQVSQAQLASQEAKASFFKISSLQMDLPESLPFQSLELDTENMTAIYSRANGLEMSVVSYRGAVSQDQIKSFLRSSDTGIPNLDKGFRFDSPKAVQVREGSGMKDAQMWHGVGRKGEEIHLAVFSRADGAGSYMVVVSGNSSSIEAHTAEFEKTYQSIRTAPEAK